MNSILLIYVWRSFAYETAYLSKLLFDLYPKRIVSTDRIYKFNA
jgi:hypothetical protein